MRIAVSEHALSAEQRLLKAELTASDEGEDELANAEVAETSALVQDLRVVSESSWLR